MVRPVIGDLYASGKCFAFQKDKVNMLFTQSRYFYAIYAKAERERHPGNIG